jgi:uncharacterized membrane protein (UPF0127 family)
MEVLCRLSYSGGVRDDSNVFGRILPFILGLLVACSQPCPDGEGPGRVTFAGGHTLNVRIADEPDEQARGLMDVEELPSDEGMIFEWTEPTTGGFWMKDTLIPLSIAFVDADRRIITIREMTPCMEDDCPSYGASGPYLLAIEANAGWFDERGLEIGSRLRSYERPTCE